MKAEIVSIKKIIDENELLRCYEIIIETIEQPQLKLGGCEIQQNENNSKKD